MEAFRLGRFSYIKTKKYVIAKKYKQYPPEGGGLLAGLY